MQRLNILESHMTGFPPQENMLAKYRKMSNLEERFLAQIYYIGNEDIVRLFESVITENSIFT